MAGGRRSHRFCGGALWRHSHLRLEASARATESLAAGRPGSARRACGPWFRAKPGAWGRVISGLVLDRPSEGGADMGLAAADVSLAGRIGSLNLLVGSQISFIGASQLTCNPNFVHEEICRSVNQTQLAGNRCAVVIVTALNHHSVYNFHNGTVAYLSSFPGWLEISKTGAQNPRVNASIAKLDCRPFSALTDYNVFDFTKAIWESLPPSMVVVLVSLFACQFFLTRNVFKVAILRDDFCAAIRIAHAPGLMELANNFLRWMHGLSPYVFCCSSPRDQDRSRFASRRATSPAHRPRPCRPRGGSGGCGGGRASRL